MKGTSMFGYQLYSSRNFPPLGDTLTMLADAGFASVEGFGWLYADPVTVDLMAASLAATGLKMPTAHFGLDMVEADPAGVVGIARRLGVQHVYVPYIMPEDRPKDGAGWRAHGARLQKAGAPLRDAGLGFGWHNHDFEFVATPDGAIPQEALFDGGPDLEWEMDVAWIVKGGADPLDWIARHGARVTAVHVKDIARPGENADEDGWADLGQGTMPWGQLLPQLRKAGVQHFILEHDNPSDHRRFATRSLAAARSY
jgi:sugar phosphate isomerase/epimerase